MTPWVPLVVGMALLAGCRSTVDGAMPAGTEVGGAGLTRTVTAVGPSRLVERPCDLAPGLPAADCYWFEVPERRHIEASRTIRLWVTVMHATGSMASQIPHVGLAGGPGDPDSTVWVDGDLVFAGGANPTFVIIDQRGTGRSQPRLACPELDRASHSGRALEASVAERRTALAACRDRLIGDGVDLNGYNTIESATDIVELRAALGFDRWVVSGWSYGGRLAQEVYRQDPTGVAGLLLDGTLTTERWELTDVVESATTAIDRVDAACAAVPACAALGSFRTNLARAEARLDAEPHRIPGSDVVVDGPVLRAGVVEAMYRQDLTARLPHAIADIAGGDTANLDALATEVQPRPQADTDGNAEATRQVVTCADHGDTTTAPDGQIVAAATWGYHLLHHATFCDIWDVEPAPLTPVGGTVPVLAYAGELDPILPVELTDHTTQGFPNRTIVDVPGGAHRNAYSNECTQSITLAFHADPTDEPDLACVDRLPRPFTDPAE